MKTLDIEQTEYSLNFRAMNTEIVVIIYGEDDSEETRQRLEQAGGQVSILFTQTEERLSRFKPESELSRLNWKGYVNRASPLLYESVAAALEMAELTGGIFDPTILENLEKAGYDRSFEKLSAQSYRTVSVLPVWPSEGLYHEIKLEPISRSITMPPGIRIDLGGIGKGMTVDRASLLLKEAGFENFAVNAGGDMYVSGHPPLSSQGWEVGVMNPVRPDEDDLTELTVQNCAVATSTVTKRRWQQGGRVKNHLIDPRTGQPVVNNLASVTVIAPTAQLADVLAKTALILGPEKGKAFIQQQPGCRALFVTMNEEII